MDQAASFSHFFVDYSQASYYRKQKKKKKKKGEKNIYITLIDQLVPF